MHPIAVIGVEDTFGHECFEASRNLLQILQTLSCLHRAKMFRLAFISTLLVISIVNLWALNCKECMGEGPDGDKKDCWEGKDGVDQGKRNTCNVLLISVIVSLCTFFSITRGVGGG